MAELTQGASLPPSSNIGYAQTPSKTGLNEYKQMSQTYFRFFFKRSPIKNCRLTLFTGIDIYLFINKEIVELLKLLTDETRYCQWVFSLMTFCCCQDFVISRQYFWQKNILFCQYEKFYYYHSMWSSQLVFSKEKMDLWLFVVNHIFC